MDDTLFAEFQKLIQQAKLDDNNHEIINYLEMQSGYMCTQYIFTNDYVEDHLRVEIIDNNLLQLNMN